MIVHIALILAVALAGGLFLLLTGRRQRDQQRTRLDVNRELYEQRKLELVQEREDGLLTENAFTRANAELDKRFVTENSELEQLHDQQVGRNIWLPAVLLVVLTVVLYSLFGSWSLQRQADEAIQALPELGKKVLTNDSAQTTREELETFALGLRQRLAREPDDAVAWLVYARSMTALGQLEQAIEAYKKSLSIEPNRVGTLLSYAQLLLQTGDEAMMPEAATMLRRVLEQEPSNQEGLSLLGFVAFQRGDWEQAITAWELLLQQIPESDERYQPVAAAVADAKQRLAATELELTVTVDVTEERLAEVPEGATLFVYVRAAEGPGMPAAVVRQPVTEFPVTVTLSDANAMLPDYRMSQLNQWQVMARISADEQIDAAEGDLDAVPLIIEPATAAVRLVIK
ncbi:c-type cytochrome biogenesis protein CcmI [Pseudidiomarina andamanensis]|uniref:C-type cytochrome biogenesis protein CcmI n=1 Tax=Pseudidiomarina andamanensis TaxID=1940690 RepID=A0AA92EU99_9GAMM|nr:c-type cytochrome biogenesis protein CcmI [Pseudidiomarina andamanensis]MDS0217832.1 c-type cytochrome biogenesis protein CcmI [Pseudidiomarina andamanensis]QGT94734.1 c-type cytochrome biogenesis protein CcmI [Pseudidiomarina andamanensis]